MYVAIHYVLRKHTRGLTRKSCKRGVYAIKIVTMQRHCLFGTVKRNVMTLNHAGKMIQNEWKTISEMYRGIAVEPPCVVMPNHIHGLISIRDEKCHMDIADIIEQFKNTTEQQYMQGVHDYGWHEGCNVLWQRNYFEGMLDNQVAIAIERRCILENPLRWELDEENPDNA